MDLYEKIKELAAQKNISIRQLEEKLGFANATLRRWNKN
ncbi:helix-turn-helix domain-containing protein, partial [Streptococcus thermophilus]|nr:helix-turn-helix domain-containing protein [Streptococcus thermophilus]